LKIVNHKSIQIVAALIVLGVAGVFVLISLTSYSGSSPDTNATRPTFYNLPVIIYSNSTYTEEIREHISYCTFGYEITSNTSHIANASVDIPIIVDGYSLENLNDWQVIEACSKALENGSVVITLWSHAYEFMNAVSNSTYGHMAEGYPDNGADVLWLGLSHGNNSAQASISTNHVAGWEHGPSMNTLTQAYEWCVREVNGQPYHPTLYP